MLYKVVVKETVTEYYDADSKKEAEKMASDFVDYNFAEIEDRKIIKVEKDGD